MPKDTGLCPRDCKISKFPDWRQPSPLSCFSVNEERFYENNCDKLRYLKIPKELPLDLNKGYGTAKSKGEMDEALDHLVEHIMKNYNQLMTMINRKVDDTEMTKKLRTMPLFPIEFVAWRGLLRLIMCTPFEYNDDWIIHVTRYKGTHYICQRDTEESCQKNYDPSSMQDRLNTWGYKFEQYCLSKSPHIEPDTDVPVDECSELSCIFETRLEGLHLLYGAEMDGIKSEQPIDINRALKAALQDNGEPVHFVELKTAVNLMNEKQRHNFQCIKTRDWWCSCFLVGFKHIFIGCRDEKGFVKNIEELNVSQLPKESKNWTPTHCARFLVDFLYCVKNLMSTVDCPYTVYEFRYDARNSLITFEIFKGLTLKTILPDSYIHFIERISKVED